MTRILFVGQKPETVDFSDPSLPAGFDAETINAGIAVAVRKIEERGLEGRYVHDHPRRSRPCPAQKGARRRILRLRGDRRRPRLPPRSLPLFEMVVNAVHKAAPGAAIAFNSQPEDTAEAAARQLNAR